MTTGRDEPIHWWLAGADADEVLSRLDERAGSGAQGPVVAGSGPARLGIVDPTERKIRLARRLVAKGEPWKGRSDIWFAPSGLARNGVSGPGGRVAFLFPGVEPTFEAAATDLPGLARRFGLDAPPIEDDTVAHRSASIYQIGIFLDRVLRMLGIAPDVVAGHSIGEWSGTVAAGIVPRERAHELLGAADLDAIQLPDLDFAALAAGVDAVAPVVECMDGLELSHDNSPRQAVICGPPETVDAALERLRAAGVLGYKLSFQSGFHTPAVAPLVEVLRPAAQSLPFGGAGVPMWSATTVAPYPESRDEIIDLHLRHLMETVRFRPLVERLHRDAGVRVFLQVGLGSLTGFVDQTLDGVEHTTVPVLTTKRSALAQIHRVVTALWSEGMDLDPAALWPESGRDPQTDPAPPAATQVPVPEPPPAPEPDPEPEPEPEPEPVPEPATAATAAPVATRAAPAPATGTAPAAGTVAATADLLATAARASRDVLDALAARYALPPPSFAAAPAPAAPAPAPASPAGPNGHGPATAAPAPEPAAPEPAAWPAEPLTLTRRMSLENMPETLDHTLFDQPEGWPDPADLFPIVAMTTQIQFLQDMAAAFAGGRDVVEVSGIRNSRWLDLSDPQDVDITVTPQGEDVLGMMLGRYCRANLHAGRYPEPPAPTLAALVNPRPTDHTAEQMFEHRIMFHGPRFHGITTLGPIGDNGMAGEFRHLETPGSLLDNLGKLIAYWVMSHYGWGEAALPIGVERIRFFGPEPPPGTEIHCDIRIVDLQRDAVTADGELVLPDGTLLCRVDRWTSIVFHRDEVMEPLYYDPTRRHATEPQPGGWHVVLERWPTGPGRELTARRYMSRAERETFENLNLLEQRRQLIDVVAAKDAVRHWLLDTHGIPCYPIEVSLVPEGERRYRARSRHIPEGHDLHVSLSAINWLAVAVVRDGHFGDIEVRAIPEDGDPDTMGREIAGEVAARNPGATVDHVAPVTNLMPSRLEVVDPPPFAVAWTVEPGAAEPSR